MFDFGWPWMAVLLPLPLFARWYWRRHPAPDDEDQTPDQVTLVHPYLERLRATFKTRAPGRSLRSRLFPVLLWTLWALLVVVLMRPQWLEPHTEIQTAGHDLMLAVDTSHSMEALDFSVQGRQVTRMQVVKGVMSRFVEGRKDDRVGLIIFGSQAFVLSPLTSDRFAVRQLLEEVIPGLAGQGTALGDAIALGAKKLRERPEGSRVMVLIADGDNSAGLFPPLEAARIAARFGVRIYVIGVGSTQKSIPIYEDGTIKYRDDLTMDEETLKSIARITRGAYFRATDTRALEEISRRIDELEKTQAETRTALIPSPLYQWPLLAAMLLLLLLGLFPEGHKRFVTRPGRG